MNEDTIYLLAAVLYGSRHGHASPNDEAMLKAYESAKRLFEIVQEQESLTPTVTESPH